MATKMGKRSQRKKRVGISSMVQGAGATEWDKRLLPCCSHRHALNDRKTRTERGREERDEVQLLSCLDLKLLWKQVEGYTGMWAP